MKHFGMKTTALAIWMVLLVGVALVYAQPSKLIVDDFEKPGKKNALGGDFGAFSDPQGVGHCYLFFHENQGAENENKYALFIQWDVSTAGAFGGYWSKLRHINLESFNYITLRVRGTVGGEIFKIGLRGPEDSPYETKISIDKALKNGVAVEWQKVTIPLKWFNAIERWDDVNIISINFEHALGSEKGAILVDDITFEK